MSEILETVKYTRVLLIDRTPMPDHDYVQNIAEDAAGLEEDEINGQPLGVAKRKEIRHLKIYTNPHEYRYFAKVEAKVGSDIMCSVVSLLNSEFKKELKRAAGDFSEAADVLIARFPAHLRRGCPYVERGLSTNAKIRFDRKGLLHSASEFDTPAPKASQQPAPIKGPKKPQGPNRQDGGEKRIVPKAAQKPKGRQQLEGRYTESSPTIEESGVDENSESDAEESESNHSDKSGYYHLSNPIYKSIFYTKPVFTKFISSFQHNSPLLFDICVIQTTTAKQHQRPRLPRSRRSV